jgi:hypothetical protein
VTELADGTEATLPDIPNFLKDFGRIHRLVEAPVKVGVDVDNVLDFEGGGDLEVFR